MIVNPELPDSHRKLLFKFKAYYFRVAVNIPKNVLT